MADAAANSAGLKDLAVVLRRRKTWVITLLPGILLASVLIAYTLPPEFRSTATIILEASSIDEKLIQTTIASYADQQIEIVQGRVLVRERLESLVAEYDPYPDRPDLSVADKARMIAKNVTIERVDAVTLKPLEKSNAFSLHYQNPNPSIAAEIATRLAALFLRYHQTVRSEAARDATSFLATRSDEVSAELAKVDAQYSQFKTRAGESTPDAFERNQAARDRAERDVDALSRDLRAAEERESLLAIQLQGLSPSLKTRTGDMTDLATVRAQLAEAEQKYTPDHPDVKRLRRALEALMASGQADRAGSAVRADNPEYLRVASQLEAARREVGALRAGTSRARSQLLAYSSNLRMAPGVEREYNEIARRRDALRTQDQEIQVKLREAELGQVFETERRGERFTLVREPFAASMPHYPNRVGFMLLGLALGLAFTALAVVVAESNDVTIRSIRAAELAASMPVLGAVPSIVTAGEAALARRRNLMMAAAYAVCFLIAAGIVARSYNAEQDIARSASR